MMLVRKLDACGQTTGLEDSSVSAKNLTTASEAVLLSAE